MARCAFHSMCVLPQKRKKPEINTKLYETEAGNTVFAGNVV